MTPIVDAAENFERGDFMAPSGETIEVKGQPIDPRTYPQNFVEVCEATANPRHLDGYRELVSTLRLDRVTGTDITWTLSKSQGGARYQLQSEPNLSISIHTFRSAALVAYVNVDRHIYVYRSDQLLEMVRDAVRAGGMERGKGLSNIDTFGVLVPLADWRWSLVGSTWAYTGVGSEQRATVGIRNALRLDE